MKKQIIIAPTVPCALRTNELDTFYKPMPEDIKKLARGHLSNALIEGLGVDHFYLDDATYRELYSTIWKSRHIYCPNMITDYRKMLFSNDSWLDKKIPGGTVMPDPSDADILQRINGDIARCTQYSSLEKLLIIIPRRYFVHLLKGQNEEFFESIDAKGHEKKIMTPKAGFTVDNFVALPAKNLVEDTMVIRNMPEDLIYEFEGPNGEYRDERSKPNSLYAGGFFYKYDQYLEKRKKKDA